MVHSRHLKRHSMPTSWPIARKGKAYISRPNPSGHKRDYSVSVLVLLRDVLGYAHTTKEANHIVHSKTVFINGECSTTIKQSCGLFDIFEIKETKEKYLVLFDTKGMLKLSAVKNSINYLRVVSKKLLAGPKYQIGFFNGTSTLVSDKEFKNIKVQDTILFDCEKKKVDSVVSLKEGCFVYVFDGTLQGHVGVVKSFTPYNGLAKDVVGVELASGEVHQTAKEYCLAIAAKKGKVEGFEE